MLMMSAAAAEKLGHRHARRGARACKGRCDPDAERDAIVVVGAMVSS